LKHWALRGGSLYNCMHGYGRIPGEVVERGLRFLEEQEFNEVVQGIDRLRAIGIIRGDGSIDYSLVQDASSGQQQWITAIGRG
jgi:hypothetical protein